MLKIIIAGTEYPLDEVASIDVDAENCFTNQCPGELPVPGGEEIAGELNMQAMFAYYRVGTKDAHAMASWWVDTDQHPQFEAIKGYEDMDLRWKLHGVPGTHGFKLIAGLPAVKMYTYFIWKGIEINMHPYGAGFQDLTEQMSSGMIEYLRSVYRGYPETYAIINKEKVKYPKKEVKVVIVGGLATNYCVLATVLQLLKAGFIVIVNLGACRAIPDGTEEKAIQQMKDNGAILITRYDEITLIS